MTVKSFFSLTIALLVIMCAGSQVFAFLGPPPLIKAVKQQDTQAVERLIAEGADVNAAARSGETALFAAAAAGLEEIAGRLVAAGADLSVPLQKPFVQEEWTLAKGATPLMAALAFGHEEIADMLLQRGAVVQVSDDNGLTPLSLAASRGFDRLAAEILEKSAGAPAIPAGISPLIAAAAGGGPEMVGMMLKKGQDPNATVAKDTVLGKITVFAQGDAVMAAAAAGDDKSIQILAEAGADVKRAAKNGMTALMSAAGKGSLSATELLISLGADVNASTAETYAVGKNSVPKGTTALMLAAHGGHGDVAELLIANGADVNASDGETHIDALFLAAEAGHLPVVKLLIQSGANVFAETKMSTALCVAKHYGHVDAARAIQEARLKVQEQETSVPKENKRSRKK